MRGAAPGPVEGILARYPSGGNPSEGSIQLRASSGIAPDSPSVQNLTPPMIRPAALRGQGAEGSRPRQSRADSIAFR